MSFQGGNDLNCFSAGAGSDVSFEFNLVVSTVRLVWQASFVSRKRLIAVFGFVLFMV